MHQERADAGVRASARAGDGRTLSRRRLLQWGAVLAVAGWGTGAARIRTARAELPPPFTLPLRLPQVLTDAEITLPVVEADVPVLPGAPTRMWTFGGQFPGPTIRRPRGATTRVTFEHRLPAAGSLTIHNHGHHTRAVDDGQPTTELIAPGTSRTYTYEHVEEGQDAKAAMHWYHDHSHGRTNRNAWRGLMGLFVVDDPEEAELGIPTAERELLLVVTDRTFDTQSNQLTDPFTTAPDPGDDGLGSGATVLVNGVPQPFVEVVPGRYRLRILNAAAFRYYNLGFAPGPELVQIGTESGLLPAPLPRARVPLGPAERADVVVDFASCAGQDLVLSSAAEDPAVARRRLPGSLAPVRGAQGQVMQFRVRGTPEAPAQLATRLDPLPSWVSELGSQADRVFAFGVGVDPASGQRVWTINGRPFDHEHVAARPELGSTETWLLVNLTTVTHSIHLHDVAWKVVARHGSPGDPAESGLKETFRLDPGDVVLVGTRFTDHLGRYMVHCHMLSHEDHAMMTSFEVVVAGAGDRPPVPGTFAGVTPAEAARVGSLLAAHRARPDGPVPPPAAPLVLDGGAPRPAVGHVHPGGHDAGAPR